VAVVPDQIIFSVTGVFITFVIILRFGSESRPCDILFCSDSRLCDISFCSVSRSWDPLFQSVQTVRLAIRCVQISSDRRGRCCLRWLLLVIVVTILFGSSLNSYCQYLSIHTFLNRSRTYVSSGCSVPTTSFVADVCTPPLIVAL
jgi:hypothetical protein